MFHCVRFCVKFCKIYNFNRFEHSCIFCAMPAFMLFEALFQVICIPAVESISLRQKNISIKFIRAHLFSAPQEFFQRFLQLH